MEFIAIATSITSGIMSWLFYQLWCETALGSRELTRGEVLATIGTILAAAQALGAGILVLRLVFHLWGL